MKYFTIENETNNIMIHGSAKEAEAVSDTERFSNEAALAKLAATWPTSRLIEIWNSLPGETPVKKFKDRATAVSRIWKAIQDLGSTEPATVADVAPQAPHVAPAGSQSGNKDTHGEKAGTTQTGAPREGSKASQVIAMLRRPEGTTVEEIMAAMKWQKHTTRALLSAGGSLTKNHGLTVTSEKVGETRRYSIKG
jgi:hypothetical protein